MRLLVVSDLHYRLRQFDWLATAAADPGLAVDVVVIAGDLLDIRSAVPIEAQSVAVTVTLAALGAKVPVLAASGNHDLDARDADGEKTARWLGDVHADGVTNDTGSVMIGDTLFTVCPWWDGPIGRARLGERLAADAARAKAQWVWVYHAPPTDSPLAWDGRREYGDDALTGWLREFSPDVVLTGHIHQAPFVPGGGWAQQVGSTWLFNPGHEPGPVPPHVVLDLTARTAVWRSSAQEESVALAAPQPSAATGSTSAPSGAG